MKTKLGILVNSNNHFDYVVALARAAHAKGKDVHIHLSQQGVFLMRERALNDLIRLVRVTVCGESVKAFGLGAEFDSRKIILAQPCHLEKILSDCDRCVVF